MNILVLYGGTSAERDVSLESGRCVADALAERSHHVELLDTRDESVEQIDVLKWDVALPMVHGAGGEDGTLQRQLAAIAFPYVGSSAEASELTFDKLRTNELLKQNGMIVPEHIVVGGDENQTDAEERIRRFADQVVTKPPRQGSSIGVSIVTDLTNLQTAMRHAFQFDDVCMVERYVVGREVTVPVLNGEAMPMIEIRPSDGWYDYSAKYFDQGTQYLVSPPDISAAVAQAAVEACRICGVSGIARVDFIVDGNGTPWLLEVNTIPGMTSHSLVPRAAAAIGLSLGELCERAIRNASF